MSKSVSPPAKTLYFITIRLKDVNKDGILSSKSYTGVWTGFVLGWPLALHTEEPSCSLNEEG